MKSGDKKIIFCHWTKDYFFCLAGQIIDLSQRKKNYFFLEAVEVIEVSCSALSFLK